MDEMVERVALAILRADAKSSQADNPNLSYDEVYALGCMLFDAHHVPMARAAIEAMREPTDAMYLAGDNVYEQERDSILGPASVPMWRAMIDKALE